MEDVRPSLRERQNVAVAQVRRLRRHGLDSGLAPWRVERRAVDVGVQRGTGASLEKRSCAEIS